MLSTVQKSLFWGLHSSSKFSHEFSKIIFFAKYFGSIFLFFDHSKNWIFFKLEILTRDFDIGYDRTIFFLHQIQSFETEKNSDKVET